MIVYERRLLRHLKRIGEIVCCYSPDCIESFYWYSNITTEYFRASSLDFDESWCGSYPMLGSTSLWFEMEE